MIAIQAERKVSMRRAIQIERGEEEGGVLSSGKYLDVIDVQMSAEDKKSMTPWLLDRCLANCLTGKVKSIRSINEEIFSIEVSSEEQYRQILALKLLNGKPIKTVKSSRYDSPKGLIYIYEYNLQHFDDYKKRMIEELPITDVTIASWIKSRNPRAIPLILSFNQSEVPQYINILGEQSLTKVYEYINRPMMCKQCLEFGHTKKWCKNPPRCIKCDGDDHLIESCNSDPKCHHCQENHFTGNKRCRELQFEMEILSIQKRRRVPRAQAKLLFQKENPNFKSLNYSKAVKHSIPIPKTIVNQISPIIHTQYNQELTEPPSPAPTEVFESDVISTKRMFEEPLEPTDEMLDKSNYESELRNSSRKQNKTSKDKKHRKDHK